MATVYVLPPAGGLQNTGYANGRTYTSNGSAIPVPDFDAFVLAANGWTVVPAALALLNGAGDLLKSPGLLAQSAIPATVTGTTAATVLASVQVPGGTLSANGALRLTTLWTLTNSANNKTFGAMFGGISFMSAVLTASVGLNW